MRRKRLTKNYICCALALATGVVPHSDVRAQAQFPMRRMLCTREVSPSAPLSCTARMTTRDQRRIIAFYRTAGAPATTSPRWRGDARSFRAKLDLAHEKRLRGFSVWVLGPEDERIWDVLRNDSRTR